MSLPWPVTAYLFCIMIPLNFSVGPLAMSTLRLFLLVMIIPMMIQVLAGRHGRILLPDILFPLHIAWSGVALLANNPDRVVQQVGSVGIEFIGGYVITRVYIRSPEAFVALCRTLVFLVLCLLPLSLIEALTGRMPVLDWLDKLPFFDSIGRATSDKRLGMSRVQSIFNHPIHFGLFCSVVLSLGFVGLRGFVGPVRRWTSTVLVGLNGFLALSSGAILSMLLQMGLIFWDLALGRLRSRWWVLIGLLALAYVVVDLLSNRTPIEVFMSYATFSPGTAYWRGLIFTYGMENVRANPVFGLGLNDWIRPEWMHTSSVDNFWLLMAMRYGIPGFLLLAIGYMAVIVQMIRRDFTGDVVLFQLRKAWLFSLIGLSFTLCTVHVWNNAYSVVFFLFGSGMWLLTAAPARSGPSVREAAELEPPPNRGAGSYTRFADGSGTSLERSQNATLSHTRPADVKDRRAGKKPEKGTVSRS